MVWNKLTSGFSLQLTCVSGKKNKTELNCKFLLTSAGKRLEVNSRRTSLYILPYLRLRLVCRHLTEFFFLG